MARGFVSGLIWGGVVSVAGLAVVSVLADGPVAPSVVALAPQAETAPTTGDPSTADAVTDADLVRDGEARQEASPTADDVSAATAAGSDTPTVPETGGADGLDGPAQGVASGGVAVQDAAPVLPSPQAALPLAPNAEGALSISTDPAQPPAPEVPQTQSAFDGNADTLPDGGDPDQPLAAEEEPMGLTDAETDMATDLSDTQDAATLLVPAAPGAPITPITPITPAAPQEDIVAALPSDLDGAEAPMIGRQATSLIDRSPGSPAEIAPAPEADASTTLPPLQAFAVPFEAVDDRPLMAIVLIDSGVDLTGGPVGLAALQSFPYPLSFAVDASLPDAAQRIAEYRAQGFEVMTLIDLPQGATASDAEVSLSVVLSAAPEVVGVMEGVGTGLQGSRDTSDQITEVLKASGHGLVLQSKGLNTAQKLAMRAGVPTGLVFRDFDSAGQTPTVIRRFLDQAAFRAAQEGGVIMVGRLRPDTISALLLWGLQDRAERVALAPISAVLTALAAEPVETE